METIQLTEEEAVNLSNNCPEYNERQFDDFKIVDLDREKYHMRQLVMVKQDGQWYGFENFDALDKHGESEIGESYKTTYDPHRPESNNEYTMYKVNEKQTVSYDYEFDNKTLEEY